MRGGGTYYLPLPKDVSNPKAFAEKFDLIAMTAHGSQDGRVFLVPENTWILFRGPASASIPRRKEQDEDLNEFRFLQSGETEEQYYDRIFNAIQNKSLFREFLFSPEDPFQPGKMSIYEPGDLIQNVAFDIQNFQYPYGLIGIWKLPLPQDVLQTLENANKKYQSTVEGFKSFLESKGIPITEDLIQQQLGGEINAMFKHVEGELMRKPMNAMHKMGLSDPSSIHEVLQHRRFGSAFNPPQFTKPYTFIVIESCRASEDLPQTMHIMPENVKGLEENPRNFIRYLKTQYTKKPGSTNAEYALGLQTLSENLAPVIKKSRRLSLGVRRVPETCYKSLYLLSRQNFARLQKGIALPAAEKVYIDALLAGNLVPKGVILEILRQPRNVNTRLLNLPREERFFVGEGVLVADTELAVIVSIQLLPGAANTATVIYRVRFADGHMEIKRGDELTRMSQDVFIGMRANTTPAEQAALTVPHEPDVEEPPVGAAATGATPDRILLFPEYGSEFYILSELVPKREEIKKQMEKYTFKPHQKVKIKAGSIAGTIVEIEPEIQYSDKRNAFAYTIRFDDGRTMQMNPAVLEPITAGGGCKYKTRTKLASKFCRCIKRVRKTVRLRDRRKTKRAKESAAIGICTKAVLQRKGRTLKRFKCSPKPFLQTQEKK
jgi:hypothetical protein